MGKNESAFLSLKRLAELQISLKEKGGPAEDGRLFEHVLDLQDEILNHFGLPPTSENEEILWFSSHPSDAELQDRVKHLTTMATDYLSNNAISDLQLLRDAQQTKQDPMYVLPELKVTTHTYTVFVYNKMLLSQKDSVENILKELRLVGQSDMLNTLGLLGQGMLEDQVEAVAQLKVRGIRYIDQFIIDSSNSGSDDNY